MKQGMATHETAGNVSDEWLTPPHIIKSLGEFDLDPCASEPRPWDTAKKHFTKFDNGLNREWQGRVWLNPPYGNALEWMARLVNHGNGVALIFARTETVMFHKCVWEQADALLFLKGRICFHHADGRKAKSNAGAPSVLVAYGKNNVESLRNSGIEGKFIELSKVESLF